MADNKDAKSSPAANGSAKWNAPTGRRTDEWSEALVQIGESQDRGAFTRFFRHFAPLIKAFEDQRRKFRMSGICTDMVLAFHGTRERKTVDSIVRKNFDPSFIGSQTDSGWWGRGFYFSEYPATSLGYGSNLLLCRVLPGKTFDVKERCDGKPLRSGYQSHRLQADANGYGQELVIDNPKQILPCYILHVQ